MVRARRRLLAISLWALALAMPAFAAPPDPQAGEYFEKNVRPLLATRCQSCHGASKQKGDLRLDSREAMLKGGGNGPAVVPGKPEQSLLIDAVNYGEIVQMPPKGKLPAAEIDILSKWVAQGAPWPADHAGSAAGGGALKPFNLKERSAHWSLQPLAPAKAPQVNDTAWPETAIDRFLLSKLEERGLKPAPDADRSVLIRRATFDLIGLPPTPEEVSAFELDPAGTREAFAKVVDRLLASPRYGERWGRHWLDLVRYAETFGHEFDYDIPNAYRYRDYVVRAFNDDLPYDQFITEHIAGDLLPNPRRNPATGLNESVVATGFYFLGEGTHSPVDVRDDEVARMDNQIDVLSKAILGLTVACARCHDHKFDAISTRDYYALKGYLQSSRPQQAFLDPPERIAAPARELRALVREHARSIDKERLNEQARGSARYLASAWRVLKAPETIEVAAGANPGAPEALIAAEAKAHGLDPANLKRWAQALSGEPVKRGDHPLHAWLERTLGEFSVKAPQPQPGAGHERETPPSEAIRFEDFGGPDYRSWFVTGDAFGPGPTGPAAGRLSGGRFEPCAPGIAHSGIASERLQGVLRSRTFTIEKKYILYRVSGRTGRINVVIDSFDKIRDPIYGGLAFDVNHAEGFEWRVQDVSMWLGHKAFIELADGAAPDYRQGHTRMQPGGGFLAVDEIVFSDQSTPPAADRVSSALASRLAAAAADSIDALAESYAAALADSIAAWSSGDDRSGLAELFVRATALGLIELEPVDRGLADRCAKIDAKIPEPAFALAIAEGTAEDERVHIRGNPKTLGDVVPRRFLEVLSDKSPPAGEECGGRIELARRILAPRNPLPARVLVNRLWKHLFGEGIVKSTDDFGLMGRTPTHPELLDQLAGEFIASGWSIKHMQRSIMLSRAYRMSSRPDPSVEALDPGNALVHRMNLKRLEAEEVRDAILAVSGRLDLTMEGPGVMPHLTPFMTGRGRPSASGPIDGGGRRSVYLAVRRNFLNPMLLAFDYPIPMTAIGSRNASNVPAQALTLLNDPFVVAEAKRWSERLRASAATDRERITLAYRRAYARPPAEAELNRALGYLADRSRATNPQQALHEFCHMLINGKEFLYIQ